MVILRFWFSFLPLEDFLAFSRKYILLFSENLPRILNKMIKAQVVKNMKLIY